MVINWLSEISRALENQRVAALNILVIADVALGRQIFSQRSPAEVDRVPDDRS
ncbi:hypothetical protein [Methylobacterium oryzisoli]|uniref:hypothetical protein n=1 Tax=Methylobacterium oryzisoli TaxID=3385502 RepID=UPI00389152B8